MDELLLLNADSNIIGGNRNAGGNEHYLPASSSMTSAPQQSGLPPVGYVSSGAASAAGSGNAFDTLMGGRRMSRGGSDRGGAGSGASSGYNSFHSDSRGW